MPHFIKSDNAETNNTQTDKTEEVTFDAPKNTIALVSPSGPVSEGSVVILSCHSDANPAVRRYEWYKDSGSGELELQNQGQTLTMTARNNVQGLYVCKVYNNHGTDQSKAVAVDINMDLVKYKSLLKRLKGFEGMPPLTYATLRKTSDSVYNVIQTRGSGTEEDYENRNLSKHKPMLEPWPRS